MTTPENTAPDPAPAADVPTDTATSPIVSAGICLVLGVVSAVIGVVAMNSIGEQFVLSAELRALSAGQIPGPEGQAKLSAAYLVLAYKNTALWMAITGAVAGALIGAATAVLRGQKKQVLVSAITTLLIGAVGGALAGLTAIKAGPDCTGREAGIRIQSAGTLCHHDARRDLAGDGAWSRPGRWD